MRWLIFPALFCFLALGACQPEVDSGQARLCRVILPAIIPPDTVIHILKTAGDVDRNGVTVDYFLTGPDTRTTTQSVHCRFESAGDALGRFRLVALTTPEGVADATTLYLLRRFWLETSAAWASDPAPVAGADDAPPLPAPLAYLLQQSANALPLIAIYSLLAAAYSLVYGLVGRINLAFGEFAAIGGYAAIYGVALAVGGGTFVALVAALLLGIFAATLHGIIAGRLVFAPLSRSGTQTGLVATVGLALFLQEYLRLTQGATPHWLSPVLNAPVPLARTGDFIVTVTPIALLTAGIAALCASALLVLMKLSRFGRDWRAYADDSKAAMLFGVDPQAIFGKTFALACALAGLSGCAMTLYYGAFGYGGSAALGLKALIAAILGGIGSIPGAFLGGLAIGLFEAAWQSYFPGEYRDLAVYLVLVAVLMFRPGGFLGYGELKPRGM